MSEYEFTDKQNTVFDTLSVSLRQFGIQLGVFAVMLNFVKYLLPKTATSAN